MPTTRTPLNPPVCAHIQTDNATCCARAVTGPDMTQADLLLNAAPALRHVAALPSTGPIPLLLTTVVNLCDALHEPVDKAARTGLPLDRAAGPDGRDVIRQIEATNVLFHRLATMLSSLLPR